MTKVSIIVRAYNARELIIDALQSIADNKFSDIMEVIVCYDKGSTDATRLFIDEMINKIKHIHDNIVFKVIEHEHMSPFRALQNCGFQNASGEFISVLDHDNIYPRTRLSLLLKIAKSTGASFIFTRVIFFENENLRVIGMMPITQEPCNTIDLIKGNYVDTNAFLIRKDCLNTIVRKLQRLSSRIYDWIHEDWLIALIAFKYCKCLFTDKTYVLYRVHRSNLTYSKNRDPLKDVFTRFRNILTLMTFYEVEQRNLSFRERLVLYFTILKNIGMLIKYSVDHIRLSRFEVNKIPDRV